MGKPILSQDYCLIVFALLQLRQELEDHIGYVNSLCFSDDGQKLYTADSIGVVLVWNSFYTEQPSKRGLFHCT